MKRRKSMRGTGKRKPKKRGPPIELRIDGQKIPWKALLHEVKCMGGIEVVRSQRLWDTVRENLGLSENAGSDQRLSEMYAWVSSMMNMFCLLSFFKIC